MKRDYSKPAAEFSLGHEHLDVTVKVEAMYAESRERVDRVFEAIRLAIDAIPRETWGVSNHKSQSR